MLVNKDVSNIAEEYPTKSNHLITNWLQFWLEPAPLCQNESCYTKHDETLISGWGCFWNNLTSTEVEIFYIGYIDNNK